MFCFLYWCKVERPSHYDATSETTYQDFDRFSTRALHEPFILQPKYPSPGRPLCALQIIPHSESNGTNGEDSFQISSLSSFWSRHCLTLSSLKRILWPAVQHGCIRAAFPSIRWHSLTLAPALSLPAQRGRKMRKSFSLFWSVWWHAFLYPSFLGWLSIKDTVCFFVS